MRLVEAEEILKFVQTPRGVEKGASGARFLGVAVCKGTRRSHKKSEVGESIKTASGNIGRHGSKDPLLDKKRKGV